MPIQGGDGRASSSLFATIIGRLDVSFKTWPVKYSVYVLVIQHVHVIRTRVRVRITFIFNHVPRLGLRKKQNKKQV